MNCLTVQCHGKNFEPKENGFKRIFGPFRRSGIFAVNRTAGLDMVYLKKKIGLKEVVSNYYKKHWKKFLKG